VQGHGPHDVVFEAHREGGTEKLGAVAGDVLALSACNPLDADAQVFRFDDFIFLLSGKSPEQT
jgi:hypothetical protein